MGRDEYINDIHDITTAEVFIYRRTDLWKVAYVFYENGKLVEIWEWNPPHWNGWRKMYSDKANRC